jgi:pimeloyl-ACP methyl ester carboxylesterase
MPTTEIRGTTIHHEQAGEGPDLLFVHGMCGDARVWAGQVERLADRFTCTAYDRRGHSRSPRGDAPESDATHADDAAALIEALDLAPGGGGVERRCPHRHRAPPAATRPGAGRGALRAAPAQPRPGGGRAVPGGARAARRGRAGPGRARGRGRRLLRLRLPRAVGPHRRGHEGPVPGERPRHARRARGAAQPDHHRGPGRGDHPGAGAPRCRQPPHPPLHRRDPRPLAARRPVHRAPGVRPRHLRRAAGGLRRRRVRLRP